LAELVDLELTAMAHGGSAVGRHAGRVLFVPFAIPGEKVRVEVVEMHDRWARARLLEVLVPSPHRVEPPCPYFGPGHCGGCHLQHIGYDAQAEFKQQVLADQLARVGGLRHIRILDMIAAEEPWHYRNHVILSPIHRDPVTLHDAEPGQVPAQSRVGFLSADGHMVFPVEKCLVADRLIDEVWSALDLDWPQLRRLTLRCGSATGDRMAVFELDHYEDFAIEVDLPISCVILLADGEHVVLMGERYLTEHVAGREYRVSAGSFFQMNTAGAEALVAVVREFLEPKPHQALVDLYCGGGLLGLALAGEVGRSIAIESAPSSASDFRHNAMGMDRVSLAEETVETALPQIEGPVDLMVLDPPRAGAGREVIGEICRLAPRRIAYVSSDPATLARDARLLADAGYRLLEVQPVDMFPQTFYIECVALFAR
jgi:23S rRNA (uracil1939-C5)-methyltransferase